MITIEVIQALRSGCGGEKVYGGGKGENGRNEVAFAVESISSGRHSSAVI